MAKLVFSMCLLAILVDAKIEEKMPTPPTKYSIQELFHKTSAVIMQTREKNIAFKKFISPFNGLIASFDEKLTNITQGKKVSPETIRTFSQDIQEKVMEQSLENFKDYINVGVSWFKLTPGELGFENQEELCQYEFIKSVCQENYVLPTEILLFLSSAKTPASASNDDLNKPTVSDVASIISEPVSKEIKDGEPVASESKDGGKGNSSTGIKSAWILTMISIITTRHSWTITWY